MDILKKKFMNRLNNSRKADSMLFDDFKSVALGFRITKNDIEDICNELEKDGIIKVERFRKKTIRIGRF